MIDINYILHGNVNSYNPSMYILLEESFIQFDQEVQDAIDNYKMNVSPFYLESEIVGVMTESDEKGIKKEKKNIFGRIGEAVRNIVKKIREFCDKCINKVKDITFSMKSSEKKMNRLVKEHPELSREKIQFLCDEGGIDFNDFKSFKEMDNAFYQLVQAAKDPKVDEKSMKGKFEKFKKKVKNDDSAIQTVAKVAGAAGAIISLFTAIKLIKKTKQDSAEASARLRKQNDIDKKNIDEMMKKAYDGRDEEFTNMGKMTYVLNAYRIKSGHQSKVLNDHVGIVSKMTNMFASAIDKLASTGPAKAIFGDVNQNYKEDIENAKDRLNSIKKYYDGDRG